MMGTALSKHIINHIPTDFKTPNTFKNLFCQILQNSVAKLKDCRNVKCAVNVSLSSEKPYLSIL